MESEKPIADLMGEVLALHRAGQFKEAHAVCLRILEKDPTHFDALQIAGGLLLQLGDASAALELLTRAIGVNPMHAASHYNRGNALMALGRYADAVASYDQALRVKPRYASAYNNRGAALRKLGQFAAAAQSFEAAFTARPDDADAYNNHGMTLMELGRREAAIKSYDAAIAIRPDFAGAYGNRGSALLAAKQFSAAADSYGRAIAMEPDVDFLYGQRLYAKMCVCDWGDFDSQIAEIERRVAAGGMPSLPFPIVAAVDSPALQRTVAERTAHKQFPARGDLGPIGRNRRQDKIHIAYVSGDFHDHPMPRLMAEVFERHDRSRFEVTALSFGPDIDDGMRQRLAPAFDRFVDVREKSDKDIAVLSRALGVDIAVDLSGYTTDSRTGIFAFRAAPVQASYIGYLGTMAAPYYDYLIADPTIIPAALQKYYTEKIVTLPSYQANDSKRAISNTPYTREDLGLPPTGFVFCCFNNSYKITPAVFDGWMRILRQVEDSVLLLFAGNKIVASNLAKEAAARGIATGRIIFCKALPAPEYMSRLRVADLFLDTRPYNAGTTASDALWAGLPVLTCMGNAFASRMAGSLLNAVGLPELITQTPADYEDRAIELATHPAEMAGIKRKLQENRLTSALFDTAVFTKRLEASYTEMSERYVAGLMPQHIHVKAQQLEPMTRSP
ncbi:MAG: O-linked N-acetylglucosamine transferase, SPINDLY family protein [Rhodospirillaceae bacterium]